MNTVTAKKSTLKTFDRYFQHVIDGEKAEAADYGYTMGTKYGKFTLIDETGEILDYGTPATVKYNGDTFGMIIWGERESQVSVDNGQWFSTTMEEIDYCF